MKKTVFNALSILGTIMVALSLFFNLWQFSANGTTSTALKFKLFDEFPKALVEAYNLNNVKFQSIWAYLVTAFALIGLIAGIIYLVFTVLEYFKITTNNSNIIKLTASLLVLLSFILLIVFTIIFTSVNIIRFDNIFNASMNAAPALYLLLIGMLISGVFGLLSTLSKYQNTNHSTIINKENL